MKNIMITTCLLLIAVMIAIRLNGILKLEKDANDWEREVSRVGNIYIPDVNSPNQEEL